MLSRPWDADLCHMLRRLLTWRASDPCASSPILCIVSSHSWIGHHIYPDMPPWEVETAGQTGEGGSSLQRHMTSWHIFTRTIQSKGSQADGMQAWSSVRAGLCSVWMSLPSAALLLQQHWAADPKDAAEQESTL